MRKLTNPEFWFEEWQRVGDEISTCLRVFYPDGTSQYLNLNDYYYRNANENDTKFNTSGDWEDSIGNHWHPENYKSELNLDTAAIKVE